MSIQDHMLMLQSMLNESEWHSIAQHHSKQISLMKQLLQHAHQTVPFYKKHYVGVDFNQEINSHFMARLPILSRDDVQRAGDNLVSESIPEQHGECYPMETSGSTGQSVRILGTGFTRLFYDALMLREHRWRQRCLSKTLMTIRWAGLGFANAPTGIYQSTWGLPVDQYRVTGPSIFINITSKTKQQIEALVHYQPNYLLTYPSLLAVLAQYCIDHNILISSLLEIRTTGESLTKRQIELVQRAWPGVRMSDIYSCCEIGNLAQQCPEYNQYHINAEHVYLEIVDEEGKACAVGQPGRVLVTNLLNYATPLIRYELGDYAALGPACACGRGLPVIKHILGRKRNRLIMPDGESKFPYLGDRDDLAQIADIAIRKFQFIQHTKHDIEIKVVTYSTITENQELQFKQLYQRIFGYPFNITVSYCDDIPKGLHGKFEEFISYADGG